MKMLVIAMNNATFFICSLPFLPSVLIMDQNRKPKNTEITHAKTRAVFCACVVHGIF